MNREKGLCRPVTDEVARISKTPIMIMMPSNANPFGTMPSYQWYETFRTSRG